MGRKQTFWRVLMPKNPALLIWGARQASWEGELSYLGHSPWEIEIHVTVNCCSESFCWKRPLLASTLSVWLHGSKGTKTPIDRRAFCARDLGSFHDAPTTDDAEEDNEFHSKEHANEAHELHRSETPSSQPGETKKTSS